MALGGAAPVLGQGSTALGPGAGRTVDRAHAQPPPWRRAAARWPPAERQDGSAAAKFLGTYAPTAATVSAIADWAAQERAERRPRCRPTASWCGSPGRPRRSGRLSGTSFERYRTAARRRIRREHATTAALPASIARRRERRSPACRASSASTARSPDPRRPKRRGRSNTRAATTPSSCGPSTTRRAASRAPASRCR